MTGKIIILGAGAIGRGYLPWILRHGEHVLVFVDSDARIVSRMREAGRYVTYRVSNDQLEMLEVPVLAAYTPSEFRLADHADAVACFFSVGPRNVANAAALFKGSTIPLILCENEPNALEIAKGVVGHDRVYFAVPDVITSNTAPAPLLAKDPLSVVTEDGKLFVEEGPDEVCGDLTFLPARELLGVQWTAKLYLHNTPHCIAAYLGALAGVSYIHEAMSIPQIDAMVRGAMEEMLESLRIRTDIPHGFLRGYADKEIARFSCTQLFDPVSRVAREPLRKLETHGRLIGAAQICLAIGVFPRNLLAGIVAALLFEDKDDPDHHVVFLRHALPRDLFNRYILGLREGEPLDLLLREQMDEIVLRLDALAKLSSR